MARISTILFLLVGYCWADEPETGFIIHESYVPPGPPKICAEITDFANFVFESDLVVDKSLLIKSIMDDGRNKLFLISCPRQWGKTVNLNMLKTFLELKADEHSVKIHANKTLAHSLFIEGEVIDDGKTKKLKSPFLISKYPEFTRKNLAAYPLIYLDLSRIFTHKSTKQVSLCVTKIYNDHKYLIAHFETAINSSVAPANVKEQEQQYLTLFNSYLNMDPKLTNEQLIDSVKFLTLLLHKCFNEKVMVLADKYHVPWEDVFYSPKLSGKYKTKFIQFYEDFMDRTFSNNPHLKKGILTGIAMLPHQVRLKGSIFNGKPCNLISGHLMEYYGFNQYEIRDLFNHLQLPVETRREVENWYKGYRTNNTDLEIYNPLNIVEFITKNKLLRYWVKSGRSDLAKNLLSIDSFRDSFRLLLEGHSITIQLEKQYFTWQELEQLYRLRLGKNTVKYEDDFANNGFMELLVLGYLTLDQNTTKQTANNLTLRFPNSEISGSMKWDLQLYYLGKFGIHYTVKDAVKQEFEKFIQNDDTTSLELKNSLTSFLNSTKLTNETTNDRVMRMMMCYLAIDVNATQRATYEAEGEERPDVLLVFDSRAIAINVRSDKPSVQVILEEVKDLTIVDQANEPLKLVKFIGIAVPNDGISIDIIAELKSF